MLGALLALLASATFALSNVTARRGVLTGSVLQALVVTIWLGVPVFLVAALAAGQFGAIARFPLPSMVYLVLAGIVHFVLGRYCNFRAISAIGVNLAGPVQEFSLLVSLALAVWLLGEVLTGLKFLGIVLVLSGPAIILRVLRAERFDVAVLLPDSVRSALAPWVARIPVRVGHARDPLRRALLTQSLEPPKVGGKRVPISMIERYLRVVRLLGCEDAGEELDLVVDEGVREQVRRRLAAQGVDGCQRGWPSSV